MTSVSVVVETITSRLDAKDPLPLPLALAGVMAGLGRQTYADFETIVVVDDTAERDDVDNLRRAYPDVKVAAADAPNYFAAKNCGARVGSGEIVALIDGDCEPSSRWLESLVRRFEPGVAAVAGRTRYEGRSVAATTFSVSDFGNVAEKGDGSSGFNLNNVAFRRGVLLENPFDERIPRNGGCYLLYHGLRARGLTVAYEPEATVKHGLDVDGFGFVRKHFDRGHDGLIVYQLDTDGLLRGSRFVQRFSALALFPLTARRVAVDWLRLARTREQIGIRTAAVPYYAAVMVMTRLIELAGGVTSALRRRRIPANS